jgi:hypothetical protein
LLAITIDLGASHGSFTPGCTSADFPTWRSNVNLYSNFWSGWSEIFKDVREEDVKKHHQHRGSIEKGDKPSLKTKTINHSDLRV